jgi:hypothetical protein
MDALLPYGGSDWPKVAKKQMCGNIKNRMVAPLLLRGTITEVLLSHAMESTIFPRGKPEAESIEKHGVWDPIPELTITSPYVHSRVDSITFTMGNPMPESTLTLCQRRLYPPVRDFGLASGAKHTQYSSRMPQEARRPRRYNNCNISTTGFRKLSIPC